MTTEEGGIVENEGNGESCRSHAGNLHVRLCVGSECTVNGFEACLVLACRWMAAASTAEMIG
jgi:hypothetical protein